MLVQHLDLVVGGFSLVGFIACAILYALRAAINREKELIETANDDNKAHLVEHALGKFQIDANHLNKQQKYELLVKRLDSHTRSRLHTLIFLFAVSVIAAISTVTILILQEPEPIIVNGEKSTREHLVSPDFVKANELYFLIDSPDQNPAFLLYEKEAKINNNPYAKAALAKFFFVGIGVSVDQARASHWAQEALHELKGAVEQNEPMALYSIAYLYDEGIGVIENKSLAFDYYNKASLKDLPWALNNLGIFYERGETVPKDLRKAAELRLKAFQESGNKFYTAARNAGRNYYDNNNIDDALEAYEMVASLGDSQAANMIGFIYQNSDSPNFDKAIEWYEKAAELGSTNAKVNLGAIYANETIEDLVKSAYWYQKAYDSGDKTVTGGILRAKLYGDFPTQEKTAAIDLAKSNIENKTDKYMAEAAMLSFVYDTWQKTLDNYNIPLSYDPNEAFKYALIAAEENGYAAQFVAEAFYNGQIVERDMSKALEYYQQAADLNDSRALYRLANIYLYGTAGVRDPKKAEQLYLQAIDEGNYYAAKLLVLDYGAGRITGERDLAKAKEVIALVEPHDPVTTLVLKSYLYSAFNSDAQSHEKARDILLEALELNEQVGSFELYQLYDHGDWFPKNKEEERFKWASKAAKQNACAASSVGTYYMLGSGTEINYEKAKVLFEKVYVDNASAAFNLALMHKEGLGVPVDYARAIDLLDPLVAANHQRAMFLLYEVYNDRLFEGYDENLAKTYLFKAAGQARSQEAKQEVENAIAIMLSKSDQMNMAMVCTTPSTTASVE